MHWSEEIAQRIIERNPNKEEYVCAAGISPSGSIHIGNFRDIATSYFVVRALRKMGKKARLLFSWDEFDRLRKVPVNVAKVRDDFEQHIGKPYADVENPFADSPEIKTYAEYFEKEFERSIVKFGIDMDYRHQAQMYRSGKYVEHILTALKKRGEIFDILDSHRTQQAKEGEREAYYPVSIYCPVCGKDTTKIHSLSDDCTVADYSCECGHSGKFDFTKDFNYK
ncbi:MAG: lysine--tRNA ligase, partial [Clostridia bacterium]|nr:lysine--tRNA ligase [Clostridia bacterium]